MPADVFETLSSLPDPVPDGTGHYKSFTDLYGKETTDEHLPSLKEKAASGHGMPYSPTAQTAKNTGIVLQCCSCKKWRLLHPNRKIKPYTLVEVNEELFSALFQPYSVTKFLIKRKECMFRLIVKPSE